VVFGFTRGWALSEAELRSLDVPVTYVASLRDEIVPLGDAALLRRCVPAAEVVVNDDVHGSPEHLAATRAQLLRSVLRASGAGAVRRAAFGTLTGLSRLRGAA
jgi:pimeloyl-ACP methyl ester carboxylesterase